MSPLQTSKYFCCRWNRHKSTYHIAESLKSKLPKCLQSGKYFVVIKNDTKILTITDECIYSKYFCVANNYSKYFVVVIVSSLVSSDMTRYREGRNAPLISFVILLHKMNIMCNRITGNECSCYNWFRNHNCT